MSGKIITILGIDDERDILDIYQDMFTRDDVVVLTTRSFEEFKKIFESRDIDIVLTDHNMGSFTSRDVIAFIKSSSKPNTLTYLCSGAPPMDLFSDTVKDPSKPIDFDFFMKQVAEMRNSLK